MTYTKSNGILKRLGALVMALGLTCALAVSANAATVVDETTTTYSVTINKAGENELSMANDIVAGDAVATVVDEGVQIDIPIKPIYGYKAMVFLPEADGYLQSVEAPSAIRAEVIKDAVRYETATLRIVLAEMPSDGVISVEESNILLYDAGTSDTYFMSHITPAFDIVLK